MGSSSLLEEIGHAHSARLICQKNSFLLNFNDRLFCECSRFLNIYPFEVKLVLNERGKTVVFYDMCRFAAQLIVK